MWEDDLLEQLIQEVELCDKNLPKSVTKMLDEKVIHVFSGMILQGKIREAVCFITSSSETGGILRADDDFGNKHPEQREPDNEAFIDCEHFPTLIDINVRAEHILKTAGSLSGGVGVSAIDASQ